MLSGASLFTRYQPVWNSQITWASGVVLQPVPTYWSGSGIAPNTFVRNFTSTALSNQSVVTSGVVSGSALAGVSSRNGMTGVLTPTAQLSSWFISGSGLVLSEGYVPGEP